MSELTLYGLVTTVSTRRCEQSMDNSVFVVSSLKCILKHEYTYCSFRLGFGVGGHFGNPADGNSFLNNGLDIRLTCLTWDDHQESYLQLAPLAAFGTMDEILASCMIVCFWVYDFGIMERILFFYKFIVLVYSYIIQFLPYFFLIALYFSFETTFYIKYYVPPHSIDVVSTLSCWAVWHTACLCSLPMCYCGHGKIIFDVSHIVRPSFRPSN